MLNSSKADITRCFALTRGLCTVKLDDRPLSCFWPVFFCHDAYENDVNVKILMVYAALG